jgi:hypothetical protein
MRRNNTKSGSGRITSNTFPDFLLKSDTTVRHSVVSLSTNSALRKQGANLASRAATGEGPWRSKSADRSRHSRSARQDSAPSGSALKNWLRIGIESKKANYINAGHSLGKREVVSSILTGSTTKALQI